MGLLCQLVVWLTWVPDVFYLSSLNGASNHKSDIFWTGCCSTWILSFVNLFPSVPLTSNCVWAAYNRSDTLRKHFCWPRCNVSDVASINQHIHPLQRAWLLKLVALELHLGDMDVVVHRDSCRRLLSRLFLREPADWQTGMPSNLMPARLTLTATDSSIHKIKVISCSF